MLGIDLARNVFRIHGVDAKGKTVVARQLPRLQLLPFMVQLQPCLVGMEACGGAHHWAREIAKLGHEVILMSPRFVRPYVKSNKNDAKDAEAILRGGGTTIDAIRCGQKPDAARGTCSALSAIAADSRADGVNEPDTWFARGVRNYCGARLSPSAPSSR